MKDETDATCVVVVIVYVGHVVDGVKIRRGMWGFGVEGTYW